MKTKRTRIFKLLTRKVLAISLLGVFLFTNLVFSLQFAAAQNEPGGPGAGNNPCENKTGQAYADCIDNLADAVTWKEALTSIKSTRGAVAEFFPESKDKKPGDRKLTVLAGKGGFTPNKYADDRIKKRKGNPWFTNGSVENINGVSIPPVGIRWVLTNINYQNKSDIEGVAGGQEDANIFEFRNEYNYNLVLAFKVVDFNALQSGSDGWGGDEKHFAFSRACDSNFSDKAWISDLKVLGKPDGMDFTDSDKLSEVEKTAKKYNAVGVCKTDNGLFAKATRDAMNWMKNAIADLLEWIKDGLLNVIKIGDLSDNKGLLLAWKSIRDFVNIAFILIMVVIAFSNILRIDTEKYGIRALLPRLVFAVIAVNFSFILVQIMTNVAFIISQPFLSQAINLLANPPADGSIIDPSEGPGQFIITLILVLAVLIGFIVMFFFFVIRILVIWLLTALAPFVFLFMVLPTTRKLASSWWSNAVKWIFMAPIAFVVLFVAAQILAAVGGDSDDVNGPDFLLKIAFFAAAAFAAVMIPLRVGGEIMQRAVGAGRGGGGLLAKKTGVAAAYEQAKASSERKQAVRGARLRRGANLGLKGASLGLAGGVGAQEAKAQLRAAKESRANEYAGQFNAKELEDMRNTPGIGKDQKEILGLAHEIRTGKFQAQQAADQASVAAFLGKPREVQQREIGNLTNRSGKEFNGAVLGALAESKIPEERALISENLSSDAVSGMLEHNNPSQIQGLQKAHEAKLLDRAADGLNPKDKDLFLHRVVEGKGGMPEKEVDVGGVGSEPPVELSRPVPGVTGRPSAETGEPHKQGGVELPPERRARNEDNDPGPQQ